MKFVLCLRIDILKYVFECGVVFLVIISISSEKVRHMYTFSAQKKKQHTNVLVPRGPLDLKSHEGR